MGTVQFFDGYFPALRAGTYDISVTHTLTGNAAAPPPFQAQQTFVVRAPEFTIDTAIVQTIYPPNGGQDAYAQKLPFLVMTDPALPWERGLIPGAAPPDPANPTSWLALLIFAEGEIYLQPGTSNPVSTTTVGDLLAASPTVLKPQLPPGWVSGDVLASPCQTITIPGTVFDAVVPTTADLPFLTHCRGVDTPDEGQLLLSVLLGNRLPVPDARRSPAAPIRYFAHLVSLEGFAAYMGPNGAPIPTKQGSPDPMDIQLVSLFNWSFVSVPEQGLGFEALMSGLVASEQASTTLQATAALRLPLPADITLPSPVQGRLEEGYAALELASGAGEDTFAWYRGPFSAAVPRPLPDVGDPAVPVSQAGSADGLMIYIAEQGLFDLSYAAAWNIGRNLALADASFAEDVRAYRQAATGAVATLAQRRSLAHLSGVSDPRALLARDASRRRFAELMGSGLGTRWTEALAAVREGRAAPPVRSRPARRFKRRPALHPRAVLAAAPAAGPVSTSLDELLESIAAWLARLGLLYPVPFSHLVPDPRMLPVESIRFFYVDPGWIQALTAGALSIAVHGSSDAALHAALLPGLVAAVERHRRARFHRARPDAAIPAPDDGVGMTGVLIRSQLVSGWPSMVITGTVGGAPLSIVRDDRPAASVRLVLFEGIPDTVTLAEPYQGLRFGVEDDGVHPRCVTSPSFTGSQIANGSPVTPVLRPPPAGSLGGVLEVQATAGALALAVGITSFARDAVVLWNGSALATTYVSPDQLSATVPAALIASAGTSSVTVASGGATSLPVPFTIGGPLQSAAVPASLVAAPGSAEVSVRSLQPSVALAGGGPFSLVVDGENFGVDAVVQWNGTPIAPTSSSAEQLVVAVPASLVQSTGSASIPSITSITVLSNGVTSNALPFAVLGPQPAVKLLSPSSAVAGSGDFTLIVAGGFGAGDFALQMVAAPEQQSFPTT